VISQKKAIKIIEMMCEMYPEAHCELVHQNAFELTIAVLLSAQTTDKSVNALTLDLFAKYKTPQDYINISIEELELDLKKIGLYKTKAKNIKRLCELLIENFDSTIPNDYDSLISLPGVGRKTANVVLSVWFNVPRIAVDTHVERISKRLKMANLKDDVLKVEEKLMYLLPEEMWSVAHHAMIFFGRYHCKSKNPNCEDCPLKEMCAYTKKSHQ